MKNKILLAIEGGECKTVSIEKGDHSYGHLLRRLKMNPNRYHLSLDKRYMDDEVNMYQRPTPGELAILQKRSPLFDPDGRTHPGVMIAEVGGECIIADIMDGGEKIETCFDLLKKNGFNPEGFEVCFDGPYEDNLVSRPLDELDPELGETIILFPKK